ncbi:UNVERIFIED_CONTAM: Protein DOG1-like 3 [Sesamum indicum]
MEKLAKILERADQLRLKTIETLVELLTPQQAAEFLVAAAELHFGVRGWGIRVDRERGSMMEFSGNDATVSALSDSFPGGGLCVGAWPTGVTPCLGTCPGNIWLGFTR